MMKRLVRNEKGFTLFELVIVIVIIGILMMVFYPKMRNRTDAARLTSAEADIMKLYEAAVMWKTNNGYANFKNLTGVSDLVNAGVWDNGHTSPYGTAYSITPDTSGANVIIKTQVTGDNAKAMCGQLANRFTSKGYTASCDTSNNISVTVGG